MLVFLKTNKQEERGKNALLFHFLRSHNHVRIQKRFYEIVEENLLKTVKVKNFKRKNKYFHVSNEIYHNVYH